METYGLTLVEAMACGTPVVAFRVGGIPEAAPDGLAAILCTWQDGDALLAAITQLRNSPQLRRSLGHAASEIALTRNGPGAFARSFARIYQDCLSTA
jgi:glycosyltransferase involved in cell wall biosynthesis